jgi:cytosine/adenosine deaminase-related metal-dependent hydrolase
MKKNGCKIALGTDNVMINSPDMFREMDYLWKVTMGLQKKRINPKEILKMATVNAGKILRQDIGVIESGKLADCVFIDKHSLDLDLMHNPHASIVHRASESTIRAVMVGGKIVHGKI